MLNLHLAWCQAARSASLSAAHGSLWRWVLHLHVYIVFPVSAVCSINKTIIDWISIPREVSSPAVLLPASPTGEALLVMGCWRRPSPALCWPPPKKFYNFFIKIKKLYLEFIYMVWEYLGKITELCPRQWLGRFLWQCDTWNLCTWELMSGRLDFQFFSSSALLVLKLLISNPSRWAQWWSVYETNARNLYSCQMHCSVRCLPERRIQRWC